MFQRREEKRKAEGTTVAELRMSALDITDNKIEIVATVDSGNSKSCDIAGHIQVIAFIHSTRSISHISLHLSQYYFYLLIIVGKSSLSRSVSQVPSILL